MRFYNREEELAQLARLSEQSESSGRMTVLTGRRRVGKTMLALESCKDRKALYLFVAKKSEHLLCEEYLTQIRQLFEVPVIGEIRTFRDVFALLLEISRREAFTLVIDEFQEFFAVNSAVYSEIQHLWDLNKASSRMHLICIGSVYSLINRIFQDAKEPLFGRADRIIYLRPFAISTIREILSDYGVTDLQGLFDCYVFTGGMPKYIDLLTANHALSYEEILDFMLSANSPFLNEGKNLLIEEFGKDYGIYFSILELIAVGKTARPAMESILEKNVGGYLERLENDYALIARYKPINAKPNSRLQKYLIQDNFLNIWFRFVFRNRSAIETGNFQYVKNIFQRDYSTYTGRLLERFFTELFASSGEFNRIGSYWEKGNQNEIDLVAINDLEKRIVVAEIKRDKTRINLPRLQQKAVRLLAAHPDYESEYVGLSLEDATGYL